MANPIQQGLKRLISIAIAGFRPAAMANPIQQGLKLNRPRNSQTVGEVAAMANPIQQGLKLNLHHAAGAADGGRNG